MSPRGAWREGDSNKHRANFAPTVLIQLGLARHPDLPDVLLLIDLVKSLDDRAALELMLTPFDMARPFFAPPGVPAERVEILRKAFDAAMKDPALIEDAAKQRLELEPMTGADMQAAFVKLHAQPLLERAAPWEYEGVIGPGCREWRT